jgi:hypothetical protein
LSEITEHYAQFKKDGQRSHFSEIESIVAAYPVEGVRVLDGIFQSESNLRDKALLALVIVVVQPDHAGARAFLIEHGWSNAEIDDFTQTRTTDAGFMAGIAFGMANSVAASVLANISGGDTSRPPFRATLTDRLSDIFELYFSDAILRD